MKAFLSFAVLLLTIVPVHADTVLKSNRQHAKKDITLVAQIAPLTAIVEVLESDDSYQIVTHDASPPYSVIAGEEKSADASGEYAANEVGTYHLAKVVRVIRGKVLGGGKLIKILQYGSSQKGISVLGEHFLQPGQSYLLPLELLGPSEGRIGLYEVAGGGISILRVHGDEVYYAEAEELSSLTDPRSSQSIESAPVEPEPVLPTTIIENLIQLLSEE